LPEIRWLGWSGAACRGMTLMLLFVCFMSLLVTSKGLEFDERRTVADHDAYAATNFPFEVVTLYPGFFKLAVDDTERAVILLHEGHHLFGDGEEAALRRVWLEKQRLGWSADKYGQSKVWKNTREWTEESVPGLFPCGTDGHADCLR
jgi:hypothetical protein